MIRRHPSALLLVLVLACGGAAETSFPGTIELDESDAAPLVGGRIVELRVQEGDSVTAGDTVAILTQTTLPAAVAERRARLAQARARLADLQRGSRAAELDRAAADLAAAEAEADRTARDLARAEDLRDGIIAPQEYDRIKAAADAAARRRDAARATLELAREGTRTDQIRAAEAEVASAEALLAGARADVGELAVLAAVSGVVLGRHADPGEVVAAGTPLATIGDAAHRWVRVYLPAALVATLPAHASAEITVAESPNRPIAQSPVVGRLLSVNAKAEFTPRAALTEEERADLLFAARVGFDSAPAGFRPGLPVVVRFPAPGAP
ncbi:MAG: HlyD family efflux transporter periplasmic adaptor subunit [Gemmatimonadota bacterium]|nr:HlyD family efflux transporter periplasmic adaptor subunit [Gemmatimonadota bacterium]